MSAQAGPLDYRTRIYDAYARVHMSRLRDIDLCSIRRDFKVYSRMAGPFLPADKTVKILDLGCGFGGFVAFLRHQGYVYAHGVDISPEMVEAARKMGIPGVEQADLTSFVLCHREEYAFVACFDVIEHFRKDEIMDVLCGIHDALSSGGRLLICTPNAMSKYGRWCRYADFTHEHIFDANSIRQCLFAAGFHDAEVLPLPPVVRGPASLLRWLMWRLWEPMLKLSFAVESGWEPGQVFTPNLVAAAVK